MIKQPFSICCLLAFLAAVTITSCDDKVVPEPEFELAKSYLEVPAEGGTVSVEYNVVNPLDDECPTYECEASWISVTGISDNEISITVSPNESEEARTADIEFVYAGIERELEVSQCGKGETPADKPFVIEIKEVSEVAVTFGIKPADNTMTYTVLTMERSMSDVMEDEELFEQIVSYYSSAADDYGLSLEDFLKEYVLVKGAFKSAQLGSLAPATGYVLLAVGMDASAERLSDLMREPFDTKAVEMVSATFDIDVQVDGPDAVMTVVPQGDPCRYFAYAEVKADVESSGGSLAEFSQSYIDMLLSFMMGLGGMSMEDALDKILVSGEYVYEMELTAETEYVAFASAVNDNGLVCSEVARTDFATGPAAASDNEITVTLSNINVDRVDYSVRTTNDDQYYFTIKDADKYAGLTDQEILDTLTYVVWSWDLFSGDQDSTWNYLERDKEYCVYAFGCKGDQPTTGLIKQSFRTLSQTDDPTTFTFEASASDITYSSALVSVKGLPHTVLYYWDICAGYMTEDEMREALDDYLENLFATSEFYTDRKTFFAVNGTRHTEKYLYEDLDEGASYKVFAVSIDENTWEYASAFTFGTTFETKTREVSPSTVEVQYGKYFDIDALADEYGGVYESFRGQNRFYLRTESVTTGDVEEILTAAYRQNMMDTQEWTDNMLIKELTSTGLKGAVCEFALPYDTDLTIISVVRDSQGRYSKVYRELINFSKDGASDISEFEPLPEGMSFSREFAAAPAYSFSRPFLQATPRQVPEPSAKPSAGRLPVIPDKAEIPAGRGISVMGPGKAVTL